MKKTAKDKRVPKYCKKCRRDLVKKNSDRYDEYTGEKLTAYVCPKILEDEKDLKRVRIAGGYFWVSRDTGNMRDPETGHTRINYPLD